MKYFLLRCSLLLFLPAIACTSGDANELASHEASVTSEPHYNSLKAHADTAKAFCRRNNMNTSICMLADLQLHSGKFRMVVWDFTKDTIIAAGLVSHGCGPHAWGKDRSRTEPVFSNTADSHCSSLGKYKIGERGYSSWGIHVKYLMHGLEASNSNALKREIVLHGWDAISDEEIFPEGTPEGWGCPAVSNAFMRQLDRLLQHRQKPVLLWLYAGE